MTSPLPSPKEREQLVFALVGRPTNNHLLQCLQKGTLREHKTTLMRVISILTFCCLIFLMQACVDTSKGVVFLNQVDKDTIIQVSTNADTPVGLILRVKGLIDDSIMVNNVLIPGGDIDMRIERDWYSPNFEIKFQSYKAKKGKLEIHYEL